MSLNDDDDDDMVPITGGPIETVEIVMLSATGAFIGGGAIKLDTNWLRQMAGLGVWRVEFSDETEPHPSILVQMEMHS